jgi:hypothetical protein
VLEGPSGAKEHAIQLGAGVLVIDGHPYQRIG